MHSNYTQVHDEHHNRAQVRSLTDSAISFPSSSKLTPPALRPRTANPGTAVPMRHDNNLFFESQPGASTSRLFQDSPSSRAQSFYPRAVCGLPSHRETMPPRTKHAPTLPSNVPPPPPFPTPLVSGPRFQPLPPSTSPINLPLQGLPESQPPAPLDEMEEDAMAAAISASNDEQARKLRDAQAAEQEEEALARAMEASVLDTGSPIHAYVSSVLHQPQTSSPQAQTPLDLPTSGLTSEFLHSIPQRTNQSQIEEDELFARRLFEEEAAHDEQRRRQDEALARQLAEQEESTTSAKSQEAMRDTSPSSESNALPRYSSSPNHRVSGREKSLYQSESTNWSLSANSSPTSNQAGLYRPLSIESPRSLSPNPNPRSARASLVNTKSYSNLGELANDSPINANNFVDADLLMGVSLNFVAPTIAPYLVPMQGPMPNIISLPYGRCPPLHLQAPNWKHLLTLLARLSGTRIEPTVEAMAMNKGDLKLRTVIQFVRTHHASTDWRTVLWFTIDHPVPPNLPGAQKFLNGDPSVLPFSYSLSAAPTLLQGNCETPMSKYYTIPATEAIPFPTLPITFPNLARYLQACVQESRRYMNDSSSGMRKLAKMIDTCYPAEQENSLYPTENLRTSLGFGNMFKRVIGRDKNGRKGRAENDETYLLVTPFVPGEWGG